VKNICMILLYLSIIALLFLSCKSKTSHNSSADFIDFMDGSSHTTETGEYKLTFAKLPSPPQCKITAEIYEIEQIMQIINNAKKESIPDPQENGWEILINISTPEKEQQISLLSEKLKIDGEYFKVDSSLKDELLKSYEELQATEEPYN